MAEHMACMRTSSRAVLRWDSRPKVGRRAESVEPDASEKDAKTQGTRGIPSFRRAKPSSKYW